MLYDFPIAGGGSGVYVKYLAIRLVERYKYTVAIALPDSTPIDPLITQYNLSLPQVPVYIGRPGLEGAKRYKDLRPEEITDLYCSYMHETLKVIDDFKPDIINCHHIMINSWVARYVRSLYGIKFVLTSHASCVHTIQSDRRYYRLSRDALRAAHAITVVSGDARAQMLKVFGSDLSKKTRTIPGGVRLSMYPQSKPKHYLETIREKYHIPKERLVLFTGRLISGKGIEYLVQAAKKIKGHIIIAGDGPHRKEIEELINRKQLPNVQLLGFLDHSVLVDLYYLADVFVSPSLLNEAFGLVTVEAMAAGVPVVVTRKSGMPIGIKDKYNGLYVRPRSGVDIAEKVNYLLDNEMLRTRMGWHARDTVIKKFTWSHIAGKFDTIFRKLTYL